jgi:hypothetical protein
VETQSPMLGMNAAGARSDSGLGTTRYGTGTKEMGYDDFFNWKRRFGFCSVK